MPTDVNVEPGSRKLSHLLAPGRVCFVVVVRQDESSCDSTIPARSSTATVLLWAVDTPPHDTCWTVLRAASAGDTTARSTFARSYVAPIQAYLRHRWRDQMLANDIDDATQEVFVESIKPGGVLKQADPNRGDFRGLLYGVVRNVARRFEERAARAGRNGLPESIYLDDLPDQAEALSRVFDRARAQSLMREALHRHEQQAATEDAIALRRFHVLRMRHEAGLAIREIAAALGVQDVATVHNDYRQARRVFVSTCVRSSRVTPVPRIPRSKSSAGA